MPPAAIVGVVVTAVAFAGSRLIGLNLLYTIPLLLVLAGGTFLLHRWRSRRRDGPATVGIGTVLAETGVAAGALFLLLQVVPFGRMPSNPPVTGEPAWDSPQTRALAVRACFDCHSNETEEPWYSNVAPISWAVSDHVESGRSKLNFSEFDKPQEDADKSAEITEEGEHAAGLLHPLRSPLDRRAQRRRGRPTCRRPTRDTRAVRRVAPARGGSRRMLQRARAHLERCVGGELARTDCGRRVSLC